MAPDNQGNQLRQFQKSQKNNFLLEQDLGHFELTWRGPMKLDEVNFFLRQLNTLQPTNNSYETFNIIKRVKTLKELN